LVVLVLHTRLTWLLGIANPVLGAPLACVCGGRGAAAVSSTGGLGLIGGGYGDREWLEREFDAAGNARIGCGFITWSLKRQPHLLDYVLGRLPAAIMLSFGDPAAFAPAVKKAGALLICQAQCMRHVQDAVDAGADIIVAQGAEAGGHGMSRSTLTLVPEVANFLAVAAPETVLVAAGGIADGRGLAAALVLGADGALIGSRLCASDEALVHTAFQQRMIDEDGDGTVRTTSVDVVRDLDWPKPFTARVVKTGFVSQWHGREAELSDATLRDGEKGRYFNAMKSGDAENTAVWVGEAVGLIHSVRPAGDIITDMVAEAERLLKDKWRACQGAGFTDIGTGQESSS
jgi:nitronate monooxygenase